MFLACLKRKDGFCRTDIMKEYKPTLNIDEYWNAGFYNNPDITSIRGSSAGSRRIFFKFKEFLGNIAVYEELN